VGYSIKFITPTWS